MLTLDPITSTTPTGSWDRLMWCFLQIEFLNNLSFMLGKLKIRSGILHEFMLTD